MISRRVEMMHCLPVIAGRSLKMYFVRETQGRPRRRSFILLSILGFLCLAGMASTSPNIVLIVADDLGWGDLSCYGAEYFKTLHLDKMASEGIRFTDAYSASPVCSPSRAALLTGRYPVRSGITKVLRPKSEQGIPSEELTLAEILRDAGYSTCLVGKWHLGDAPQYLPTRHGFQEYFGLPYSNDMRPRYFLQGENRLEGDVPMDAQLTRRYTSYAVDYIRRSHNQPFFLFISHSMPHVPIDASPKWKSNTFIGVYGDTVQELDWSVGRILATLTELGLDQNTVVLFTSDNGAWRGGSNGILRGRKKFTWEGGMRVPLIIRPSEGLESGRVSTLPCMNFDLFCTCLHLAGIEVPPDRRIDGRSLLGELRDVEALERDRLRQRSDPLFFMDADLVDAVREGRWKLFTGRRGLLGLWRHEVEELYDLRADVRESQNKNSEHPATVARLRARIESFQSEFSGGQP
jgi:arylsulfatase A-like enzyme